MSLSLQVEPLPSSGWYTSGDEVKGKVVLHLSKAAPYSKITVSLEAMCYTSLDANLDKGRRFDDNEVEITYLLDDRLQVFPEHGIGLDQNADDKGAISYTLAEGSHEYPFRFVFPLYSVPYGDVGAKRRRATVLPPSLSDTDNNVVIQYVVIVKAHRGGNLFPGSNLQIANQPLIFLPSDVVFDEPSQKPHATVLHQSLYKTALAARLHSLATWCGLRPSKTETCVPCNAARFELQLDSFSIVPGTAFSPQLRAQFKKTSSITIRHLSLDLKVITSAKARNLRHTFEKRIPLHKSLKAGVEVAGQPLSSADLLEGVKCVIPVDVAPTFLTQNVQRSYKFLVDLKHTHPEGGQSTHHLVLEFPIVILSGVSLPDWRTGEVTKSDRPYNQEKFYFQKYLGD